MILVNDNYPVFEADQVLSQKHLNKLISYLEEQDRASRIHLLGMGIVCGLQVNKPNATTVVINCGTGITSLGYLIPFDVGNYTHFKETTISDNFLSPDIEEHEYLSDLYQYTQMYQPFKNCLELLKGGASDEDKEPITEATLDNKVVMLLIEALLIDEKNCVALDCADKGKRLEFKIRPLLIDADLLEESEFDLTLCNKTYFDNIALPRYNVPKDTLTTSLDVLNAHNHLILKTKSSISQRIKVIHDHYANDFSELEDYIRLNNVESQIASIHAQNEDGIYLQYVWDWMSDIAATYNEIVTFHACNPSLCCPDKEKFPFHVLLGSAEFATAQIKPDNDLHKFRTPFIKTGILAEAEKQQKQQLQGLLEKLIHLVGFFSLNLEETLKHGIKITPSRIGKIPLSKRAIPYYYRDIPKLNTKWSPELSFKNKNHKILSYHSTQYNPTNAFVNKPLEFDIEPYNFFRVEGHIGVNYTEALTEIVAQQEAYRLPFKVVAVNAVEFSGKKIDIANQREIWDDMELDYDLAKEKTYNITEYVIIWIKSNRIKIQEQYTPMNDQVIASLESILVETRDLLVDKLEDFLPTYEVFYEIFEELNELFLFHRKCISIFNVAENSIIEDLVDHLDEINNLFLEDPFTIIHEEANRRWKAAFRETFLQNFLEKHPGVAHEGGVSKGGTFVLVYTDNSVFEKVEKVIIKTNLIERIKGYKKMFRFSAVEVKEIQEKNVIRRRASKKGRIKPKNTMSEACREMEANIKKELLEAAKRDMHEVPIATRKYLEEKMTKAFDSRVQGENLEKAPVEEVVVVGRNPNNRNIPERVVIADFYLPYLCCSNGNNINIVLGNPEPIIADFEGVDFDENDFFTNDQ